MTGRACTENPFYPDTWSPTVADVDARKKREKWAFQPVIPHNKTPLPVTDRDQASIAAAMAGGVKVKRFDSLGNEVA